MRRQHVANIMWTVRKKAGNSAATGVRVEDAVSLDSETPGVIEGVLIICGTLARLFTVLTKKVPGSSAPLRSAPMPIDICLDVVVQAAEVGQEQPKRLVPEIG